MFRKYCRLLTAGLSIMVLALPGLADEVREIPPGTSIKVRIIDQLSSEESETGDIFHGTLDEPIQAHGKERYPRGADVSGRVSDANGRPIGHAIVRDEPTQVTAVIRCVCVRSSPSATRNIPASAVGRGLVGREPRAKPLTSR